MHVQGAIPDRQCLGAVDGKLECPDVSEHGDGGSVLKWFILSTDLKQNAGRCGIDYTGN